MSGMQIRVPRFGHVAMGVPADLLGKEGRRELCDFYGEVFGWVELPTETVDRRKLVFQMHTVEQFVFLVADDPPMTCPRPDHVGLAVGTEEELDAILARAKTYRERDDRVDIIAKKTDDHGMLAKETAGIDVFSGGRRILGLGAGWCSREYPAYGYEYPENRTRLAVLEETITVIPRLWSEETVTFAGEHLHLDGANCDPEPLQRPRPPIWVGGGEQGDAGRRDPVGQHPAR